MVRQTISFQPVGKFAMSKWEELSLESKIQKILEVSSRKDGHHFGRPFLTSYQIAISFAELHPKEWAIIGKSIGGKGAGMHDSLAKYFARQLSKRIKNNMLSCNLEGGFLHGEYLEPLQFECSGKNIKATTNQIYSMFRLRAD